MKDRSRFLLIVLLGLALLLPAVPAGASQVGDPNDVPGQLDLKELTGTKADASAALKITLVTHGNWKKTVLQDTGDNRLFILFNVDSDHKTEFVGEIFEVGGKLTMQITGSGSSFENLPVRHPNGHTIKTIVPGDSPPNPVGSVRLAARSRFENSGSCDPACKDRAPDSGWLTVS